MASFQRFGALAAGSDDRALPPRRFGDRRKQRRGFGRHQIKQGDTCHIAYVDAKANNDANELARQAADNAGDFSCLADEVEVIGAFDAY